MKTKVKEIKTSKNQNKEVKVKIMKKMKVLAVATMVSLGALSMVACKKGEPEVKIERDVQGSGIGEYKGDKEVISGEKTEVESQIPTQIQNIEETTVPKDNNVNVGSANIESEGEVVEEVGKEISEDELKSVLEKYQGATFKYDHREVKNIEEVKSLIKEANIENVTRYEIYDNLDYYAIVNVNGNEKVVETTKSVEKPVEKVVETTKPVEAKNPVANPTNFTFGADGKPIEKAVDGMTVVNPNNGIGYIYSELAGRWVKDTSEEQMAKDRAKKEQSGGLSKEEIEDIVSGIQLKVN